MKHSPLLVLDCEHRVWCDGTVEPAAGVTVWCSRCLTEQLCVEVVLNVSTFARS